MSYPRSNFPKRRFLDKKYDAIVASSGGVGTTFFMEFLDQHILINSPTDRDRLKHSCYPPLSMNAKQKAIYIIGDPITATISLFRREYHFNQAKKLLNIQGGKTIGLIQKHTTLQEYAEAQVDCFQFEAHYKNWRTSSVPYPILFVKYEKIWDNLDAIFDFLNLPRSLQSSFPEKKQRNSSLDSLSDTTRRNLMVLYQDFADKLDKVPDIEILPARPFAHLIQIPILLSTLWDNRQSIVLKSHAALLSKFL
jgi:Sulfotransferase domain